MCWGLASMMYMCSVALAMVGIQVSIDDIRVEAGQDMHVVAEVANSIGDVDYDWYIDGVWLEWVSTHWLDLSWETYVSLFPEDTESIVTRTLLVTATDELWTSSDTASVSIVYESWICGDGQLMSSEECDDGNLVSGDGCSEICTCEGMCASMLMRYNE